MAEFGYGFPSERFEYLVDEIKSAPEPEERVRLAHWDFQADRQRKEEELVTERKAATVFWAGLVLVMMAIWFSTCTGLGG